MNIRYSYPEILQPATAMIVMGANLLILRAVLFAGGEDATGGIGAAFAAAMLFAAGILLFRWRGLAHAQLLTVAALVTTILFNRVFD